MAKDSTVANVKTTLPMKLFEDLASVSQKQRVAAAEKLENHLLSRRETGENVDADKAYTIKRLVRGLASNRKLARVGFATALANCLSKQCVPLSDTLASLSDPTAGGEFLKTSGTMGKADRTHTIIGQLFFVATIAKGILEAKHGTKKKIEANDVTKLTSLCVDAFKHKPILRQMACSVLGQLVSAVMKDDESASDPKSAIFHVLQPLLKNGWASSSSEIDAADLLLLALIAEPIAPSTFWVESSWLSSEPAQARQSFVSSLLSDPGKVAAVIVSARQTPFVHLAAVKLLDMLSSQLSRRKMMKRFFLFWSELVNERFLLPASPISHKTAALQLAVVALTTFLRQAPSLIPLVLSPQLIELLSSGLRRPHCREHEAVLAFFEEIISGLPSKKEALLDGEANQPVVEPNENYHLTILACFMRPPTRVWHDFPTQFDKMLRASPPATVARLSELMKSIASTASFQFNYDYEKADDENVESHRWEDESATLSARRWAVSHLASNLTLSSPAQSSGDIVSIVSTVLESCLFVDNRAAPSEPAADESGHAQSKAQKIGLFPREQAVNFVLRAVCAATSPGIAEHLASTPECVGILKSVLSWLKNRILSDDKSDDDSQPHVISPIVGDAKKAFESLLKISKKKAQPETVLELLRLFACHAAVLLACYPTDKEIIQLGSEIFSLFSSVAESDDDDSSKEGPARVFLDMLIGLLSRKSRPIRQVTTGMFAKLIANRKLLSLLTSSSNADSDSQASSLIDLIVNALLSTQFVEDAKENDEEDEEEEDEHSEESGDNEEDEGNAGDDGNGDGTEKKLKTKRKRTASGHIIASTAPVNNDENDPNHNDDNVSSVDSMIMDDEEMFKLDSVFAAAVKAATAGGGPAKRARRERKNQFQEMKEFHMKLVSWLEMVVQKAHQIIKEGENRDSVCDGNRIIVDVIGVLMNTLSNKKKVCSPVIEIRLCEIIRMAITPWRQSKAIEGGSAKKVAKALSAAGEMILDASLQIVRNISSTQAKLETTALVVELLLLCSSVTDAPAIKSKSIIAALKNSLDAYLIHASPHGHVFFSALISSPRLELKQLERIFFDRLLQCLAGKDAKQASGGEKEGDGDEKNAPKTKSFPRSQAARLLANSQLITVNAYKSRPQICQELGLVLDDIIQSFVADIVAKREKEELIKEPQKSTQQPWLYRNVIDLVKRHVYAVLGTAGSPEERVEKLAAFAQLAANIETIRDNSLGKKLSDVRQACSNALKMLKKKGQPQNEQKPIKSSDVKTEAGSGKKRRNDGKSDDVTPEKVVRTSPEETPTANSGKKEKSSSAKKRTRSSTSVDN